MKFTKRQLIKIIREEVDQNKDGKNDFDDVKIARMKASGMSDKEIKEKHPELFESDNPHPRAYGAPQGSKRDKALDKASELYKKGDIEGAVRAREKEEKRQQDKGVKSRPRKDTGRYTSKKESVENSTLRSFIREILVEEIIEEKKKKRKKSKKKRKSSGGGLSAATKETLKKKAQKRGLTPSSVYAEFRKGLAAWVSSGSRKGMSQHQWAHARVNSATPSKSWAVVKKSKAKKK